MHMLTVQYRMHPEIRAFPSGGPFLVCNGRGVVCVRCMPALAFPGLGVVGLSPTHIRHGTYFMARQGPLPGMSLNGHWCGLPLYLATIGLVGGVVTGALIFSPPADHSQGGYQCDFVFDTSNHFVESSA